jgi:hypothetical protein
MPISMLARYYDQIRQYLPNPGIPITPIDIQNVADYFFMENPKEHWTIEDFPCVAPPWPVTWMEFKIPPYSLSEGKKVPFETAGSRLYQGALLVAEETEDLVNRYGDLGPLDVPRSRPGLAEFRQYIGTDPLIFHCLPIWREFMAGDSALASHDLRERREHLLRYRLEHGALPKWACQFFTFECAEGTDGLAPGVANALYLDEQGRILHHLNVQCSLGPR